MVALFAVTSELVARSPKQPILDGFSVRILTNVNQAEIQPNHSAASNSLSRAVTLSKYFVTKRAPNASKLAGR